MFRALTSTLTSLGISVASHLFTVKVECCQNVTGVGRAWCWALNIVGERKKAGVGKQKWYQTWYQIPCGQEQDNGEWESALVLINTEHKALRCCLRHFASPPSGTGRPAAKPEQSSKPSPADGEHEGSFFPDQTLPVDRKYAMDWNSFSSHPALSTCWLLTPPPCTVQKKGLIK